MEVGEDQNIDQALSELRELVRQEYGQPWNKRRYGYHEKPSVVRRKRKKMARARASGPVFFKPGALALRIGQKELLERTGPTMAMGR